MFLEQLKNHYEKLSLNEQEVIDYLMKQENLDTLTLKKMSADLYLSSSTIVRACKKLGYHTFNDLRYDLRLSKELSKYQGQKTQSSFEELKGQLTLEFNQTLSILSEEDFHFFAQQIINARRIFCIGVGSSYMAMSDFNRKLKLVNLWSNDYFEHYSIKRIADISTKEDVIIVFSLGGRTEEVNQSVYAAKQNGTRILSITSLGNTYLSQLSDGVIYVYDTIKKHEKLRCRLMFNLVGTLLFEVILDELAKGDI